MTLTVLLVGVVLEIIFALFSFMFVAFSAASTANNEKLSAWKLLILNVSIYLVPAVNIFVAVLLIYFYHSGSPYLSSQWHWLPVTVMASYIAFVASINKK